MQLFYPLNPRVRHFALAVASATMIFVGLPSSGPTALAQVSAPSAQLGPATLAGAWLTAYKVSGFTTTVPVLLTFHDDRTVIEADSPVANPLLNPPAALSDGQGAWTKGRDGRDYTFYYRKLIFDQTDSTPAGSTATSGKLRLSEDGQSFEATIAITFLDKDSKVTMQTNGTVSGTRIVVPAVE